MPFVVVRLCRQEAGNEGNKRPAAQTVLSSNGRNQGGIPPQKPTKVTLFTMILYNSENSIRDVRPFMTAVL